VTSALDDITDYALSESEFSTSNYKSISDTSDTSDNEKVISIAKCLRLHSGSVSIQGTITSISRLYKMIKSVILHCKKCGLDQQVDYKIPTDQLQNVINEKCSNCETSQFEIIDYEYVNAVRIELQDSNTFNDIEKIYCILFDENTLDIQIGSKVIIEGSIQIIKQKIKNLCPIYIQTRYIMKIMRNLNYQIKI
jgi:DNA replicative helicase MCM subunit Mcm2 (Cdc46/Mcm family)